MTSKTERAAISWEGNSLKALREWPKPIQTDFGHSLGLMQDGLQPKSDVRPMPSIGKGVAELKESDDSGWYRVIYLSRINNVIYVLHCFRKDTTKTEKHDIETAEKRLSQVKARLDKEKRNAKRKYGK